MDTNNLHVSHENAIDDAFLPLRCFSDALCEMNVRDASVHPTSIGVALRALVEKCSTDLLAAMDAGGSTQES